MTIDLRANARASDTSRFTPAKRLRDFGRAPRVVALDIARGIAVLGMAAAHTADLPGELRWTDPSTWGELVSGRSSILFALLAGISIALMSGRARVPAQEELGRMRLSLVARGLVIFVIGLGLELLGSSVAVILTFYGAVYAVSVVFIGMRVRSLVIWAAALAIAGPVVVTGVRVLTPSASGSGVSFVLDGTYSIVVWCALMIAGLAFGRLDVTRKKTAALGLALGVLLSATGYAAGASMDGADMSGSESMPSSSSGSSYGSYEEMVETTPGENVELGGKVCEDYGDGYISCYPAEEKASYEDSDLEEGSNGWSSYFDELAASDPVPALSTAFFDSYPHSGGTMEILGSGGLALAIVSLLLLTGSALRYVLLPVAAVGSMPLTAYSAHVIVIWAVAAPNGWDQPPSLYWWLAGGILAACTAWAILVGRGPLERLTSTAVSRIAR